MNYPQAYYDGYQAAYTEAFCPYMLKKYYGRLINLTPYHWWMAGKNDGINDRQRSKNGLMDAQENRQTGLPENL